MRVSMRKLDEKHREEDLKKKKKSFKLGAYLYVNTPYFSLWKSMIW